MKIVVPVLVVVAALMVAAPLHAAEVKKGHSCGCERDSYSVYGAGQDTCQTFLSEYAANPDSDQVDGSFGQTLGWLAGYMSATNRTAQTRDVYDMGLDYLAHVIANWCQQNPDKVLSEAMDSLTDSKSESAGLLQ